MSPVQELNRESESPSIPAVPPNGTPGPPTKPLALHQDQSETVDRLNLQRDTTVFRLLMGASTKEEFRKYRTELFEKYVYVTGAISNVIKSDISKQDLGDAVDSSYGALAKCVSEDAVLFSGEEEARGNALYSLDALHRSHALLCQIIESFPTTVLAESHQVHDSQLLTKTSGFIWFALMHLHAMLFAMENDLTPSPEVLVELLAGLGVSASAYTFVREAWGLRFDGTFEADFSGGQDEESKFLAHQSDYEYCHFIELNPTQRP